MNTHPTHTRVWVGWGLWPLIVPIGVDVFLFVCVVPSTPWQIDVFFFAAFVCFSCIFWSVGVCVEGVFCPK